MGRLVGFLASLTDRVVAVRWPGDVRSQGGVREHLGAGAVVGEAGAGVLVAGAC
ncbi:MAG: hypothetical protein H5U02_14450, partial [Clostridia bacterium]|nr:hypothetical protein [Clostridia bacterium]